MSKSKFQGTWCVGREGLVISFIGKDSLDVWSKRDESMKGNGTYENKDSMLVAKIKNEDLNIEMGYKYKWKTDSLIRAKILYITINEDSVNHPHRWLRMRKCDPETYDPDNELEDELDEEAEEE